eukprot:1166495-Amorphochlora_amoeboformis.AAC.1
MYLPYTTPNPTYPRKHLKAKCINPISDPFSYPNISLDDGQQYSKVPSSRHFEKTIRLGGGRSEESLLHEFEGEAGGAGTGAGARLEGGSRLPGGFEKLTKFSCT